MFAMLLLPDRPGYQMPVPDALSAAGFELTTRGEAGEARRLGQAALLLLQNNDPAVNSVLRIMICLKDSQPQVQPLRLRLGLSLSLSLSLDLIGDS